MLPTTVVNSSAISLFSPSDKGGSGCARVRHRLYTATACVHDTKLCIRCCCVETSMARWLVFYLNWIQHSCCRLNRYRWLIADRRQRLDLWRCVPKNNDNGACKSRQSLQCMSERASNNNKMHTYTHTQHRQQRRKPPCSSDTASLLLETRPSSSSSKPKTHRNDSVYTGLCRCSSNQKTRLFTYNNTRW